MSNIILNDGQQQASDSIVEFLNNKSTKPYFTLSGEIGRAHV